MPDEFTAGDTIKFTSSLSDFPFSDGWDLTHYFTKDDGTDNIFNVEAEQSESSEDYLSTIATSDTENLTPGRYSWRSKVKKSGETSTIEEGSVFINPSYASAVDTRSNARKIIDAIDAQLAGDASPAQKRFKVRDREVEQHSRADLIALRSHYLGIVQSEDDAEKLAQGLGTGGRVSVRFQR